MVTSATESWRTFIGVLGVVLVFFCLTVNSAVAQGNNTVYTGPNVSRTIGPSTAFIDASAFSGSGDVCAKVNAVLKSSTYANLQYRGVIDARGVKSGSAQVCSINPWSGTSNPPSVILLPSGTITINSTWSLPTGTRIIGEGSGSSGQTGTVLFAGSAVNPMIQFGTSTCNPCFRISVEDLTLNGNNQNITGILNQDSQELSYVRRVGLINISGTGLNVGFVPGGTNASDSGPYSDIYYSGSGTCASISTLTRGIHGLTCIGLGSTPAAILLDGHDNTLEDIYISGYTDGILVGSIYSAQSNLLVNINGTSTVANVIHISNRQSSREPGQPAVPNGMDLSIFGVTVGPPIMGGPVSTFTIFDELTSTKLQDANVAAYLLGEPVTINGLQNAAYSRFTTSPSIPVWYVGSTPTANSQCGTNGSGNGSLYSATSGAGPTLWACVNGHWKSLPGT